MSCPHFDDHLRTDLDSATAAFLRRHAESCPDCHRRLEIRRAAYAVLASDVPPLTQRAQAAQWSKLEEAIATPEHGHRLWLPAFAGIAAVAALALFSLSVPVPDRPLSEEVASVAPLGPTRLRTGQKLEVPELHIEALEDATFELPEGPEGRRLIVVSGTLDLSASATPPGWMVDSPNGTIHLLGERLRVAARPAPPDPPQPMPAPKAAIAPERDTPRPSKPSRLEAEPGEPRAPRTIDLTPGSPTAPPPTPEALQDSEAIEEARSLIGRDDVRAVELAESVIARRPEGPTEAAALMIAADGWRRRGGRAEAAEYYRRASEHERGRPYAEEALLRRASMLFELDRLEPAKLVLTDARARFVGAGSLAPERTALLARIQYAQGLHRDAAQTLLGHGGHDRVLDEPKVMVAEALVSSDRDLAKQLAMAVGEGPFSERAKRVQAAVPDIRRHE